MYRGMITFVCHDCGNEFEGMDTEWAGTAYTCPVPCPKCGSRHTRPKSLLSMNLPIYRKIWREIDKQDNKAE
jgi:DNA-directed RNA polymerase subunit RPC12/RpoP